jgi:hypothetical protein
VCLLFFVVVSFVPIRTVKATKFINTAGLIESLSVGSTLSGDYGGVHYDIGAVGSDALAHATIKNSPLSSPYGTGKYAEWNVPATNPSADPHGIGPGMDMSLSHTLVEGNTYYQAAFWRFERINGLNIWHDTPSNGADSYNKMMEMRGGQGFRWILGVGWNAEFNNVQPHTFTFATYHPAESFDHFPSQYYEHMRQNVAPYSATNPYLCHYETWYGVVEAITVSSTDPNGRVQLWINGTKVVDYNMYTMDAGAHLTNGVLNGTVAQPAYDAPAHKIQMAGHIVTDNWQDILDGGYLSTGSTDTTPPAAPTGLGVQ